MNIYKPEVFQGSFRRDRYFEGWYFKQVSQDLKHVISIIPGISLTKHDHHSFIQIINGISGETAYYRFPAEEFIASRKKLYIKVGESEFSEEGIRLNIDREHKVEADISFSDFTPYPKKLLSPGIMGWYSFVPFMECKHGIVSVQHQLNGHIRIDGSYIDLNGGNGYSEKDWGTSFPESWIWVHCNNFSNSKASLTFSVAKIPWMGNYFIGLICFLYYNARYYLFATYNESEITQLKYDKDVLTAELRNKDHTLKLKVQQNRSGSLKAPSMGEMTRVIKESIDSDIEVELWNKKDKCIYRDHGRRAGMEIIEKILTYF